MGRGPGRPGDAGTPTRSAASKAGRYAARPGRRRLMELAGDLLLLSELLLCLVVWLGVPLTWLTLSGLVTEQTRSPAAGMIAAIAGTVASACLTLYAARRLDEFRVCAWTAAGRRSDRDPLTEALVWLTVLTGLAVAVWFLFFQGAQNVGPLP